MRSLVVTRWGPHRTDGGAALRNAQNLAALADLGPVDVLSVGGPEERVHPVPGIAGWTHFARSDRRPAPGSWLLPGRHPMTDRHMQPEALAHIRSLPQGRYGLAVVEEIALAGYVAPLKQAGMPVVFDAHNVEARLRSDIDRASHGGSPMRRLRQQVQDKRLQAIEAATVGAADLVWACSALDADLLRGIYRPKAPVSVVPNAINPDVYAAARAAGSDGGPPRLLYIGTYSYRPNEVAALRLVQGILPALRARGFDPQVTLVGREPTPALRAVAERDRAITVTGAVESVLPYLAQPCIIVLPITLGSGTRLKILEAFAAACPVVSSAKGAEGIAVASGRNLLLAESDEEFTEAVARLLQDPEERRMLGQGGYDTVQRLYSWQAAAQSIRASLAGLGSGA